MDYVVRNRSGHRILELNASMVEKMKLSEKQVELIKELHLEQHTRRKKMAALIDQNPSSLRKDLRKLLKEWRKAEYLLQEAWGFRKNKRFHKEFELPGCLCPKMDNMDMFGSGLRWVCSTCPYHGEDEC